jgi:hypothetical protein
VIAAFPADGPVPSVGDMANTDFAPQQYTSSRNHPVARAFGVVLLGFLALFLVGRGVAEFFIIHYNDPASYANSWGGPSLAGVFAVHSGPAVAIVAGSVVYLCRRLRRAHRASLSAAAWQRIRTSPGHSPDSRS